VASRACRMRGAGAGAGVYALLLVAACRGMLLSPLPDSNAARMRPWKSVLRYPIPFHGGADRQCLKSRANMQSLSTLRLRGGGAGFHNDKTEDEDEQWLNATVRSWSVSGAGRGSCNFSLHT
jgi:hypothetical protein